MIRGAIALVGLVGCAAALAQNRQNEAAIAACDRGDATACLRVGRMWRAAVAHPLRPEDDVSRERADSLIAYDRACTGGVREACSEGAELFSAAASPWESEHPDLGRHFEAGACELGDDDRCFVLAGRLVGSDPRRVALVRQVCHRSPDRCARSAYLLWDHDRAIALELAWHACKVRAAAGCSAAAEIGFEDRDRDALLAASCELRTANDCYRLGLRELETPAGAEEALEHLRTACKLDHAAACVKVGELKSRP